MSNYAINVEFLLEELSLQELEQEDFDVYWDTDYGTEVGSVVNINKLARTALDIIIQYKQKYGGLDE